MELKNQFFSFFGFQMLRIPRQISRSQRSLSFSLALKNDDAWKKFRDTPQKVAPSVPIIDENLIKKQFELRRAKEQEYLKYGMTEEQREIAKQKFIFANEEQIEKSADNMKLGKKISLIEREFLVARGYYKTSEEVPKVMTEELIEKIRVKRANLSRSNLENLRTLNAEAATIIGHKTFKYVFLLDYFYWLAFIGGLAFTIWFYRVKVGGDPANFQQMGSFTVFAGWWFYQEGWLVATFTGQPYTDFCRLKSADLRGEAIEPMEGIYPKTSEKNRHLILQRHKAWCVWDKNIGYPVNCHFMGAFPDRDFVRKVSDGADLFSSSSGMK